MFRFSVPVPRSQSVGLGSLGLSLIVLWLGCKLLNSSGRIRKWCYWYRGTEMHLVWFHRAGISGHPECAGLWVLKSQKSYCTGNWGVIARESQQSLVFVVVLRYLLITANLWSKFTKTKIVHSLMGIQARIIPLWNCTALLWAYACCAKQPI